MRAYPRERGGTSDQRQSLTGRRGLSPRARGNPVPCARTVAIAGPIPASAGEPESLPQSDRPMRAYPRERGGTPDQCTFSEGAAGLSPRARGNLQIPAAVQSFIGPIPASAGEPMWRQQSLALIRAYPRERGGTVESQPVQRRLLGLSPRARGNPQFGSVATSESGPIPASAGGTSISPCASNPQTGLSPRARGNLKSSLDETDTGGAYPRERGGTGDRVMPLRQLQGLSPRARGNR